MSVAFLRLYTAMRDYLPAWTKDKTFNVTHFCSKEYESFADILHLLDPESSFIRSTQLLTGDDLQ